MMVGEVRTDMIIMCDVDQPERAKLMCDILAEKLEQEAMFRLIQGAGFDN